MDAKSFLAHIFDQCNGVPVTVSSEEGFKARRWIPGKEPPAGETYFCISTVRDVPRARILSRQTEDLIETCAVVLDDVGTKVDPTKILLPPTYKLRTSPGNDHWGFVFETPVEPARAAALIEALAAVGLTDKGAKRADRVMRLPGSLNRKFDPPFAAELLEWHPERLYTFSELCAGLGVVPTDTPMRTFTPAMFEDGESDPVLDWLVDHGRVIEGPNPRGWYAIHCPWESLHTGEVDHGTDYLPGKPGGFKCLHGHCSERTTADLRAWIVERDPSAAAIDGNVDTVGARTVGQLLAEAIGLELVAAGNQQPATSPDAALAGLAAALQAQAGAGSIFGAGRRGPPPLGAPEAREWAVGDLIHVGPNDKYWSIESRCYLSHRAVDDIWTVRLGPTGLLERETPAGKPGAPMAPHQWLKHNHEIRRVSRVVHRLGEPVIVGDALNVAMPLPVWPEVEGDIGLWLDLMAFVCKDDKAIAEWLIDWSAMVLGDWTEKPGWHILTRGIQGTGKNMVMWPVVHGAGEHAQNVNVHDLGKTFTKFLSKRFLYVEELKMTTSGSATGHDVYANLKAWTARGARTVMVNEKYVPEYEVSDRSCWHLSSNELVPLPLERGDRRFLVIETPDKKGPMEWYGRIKAWYERDQGLDKVVTYLHRRWLAMPELRRELLRGEPPVTAAKLEMIDSAAEGIEGAVRLSIAGRHDVEWPDLMRLEDVMHQLKTNSKGLLTDSLIRQVSQQRVIPALKAAGAVRLFDGDQITGADDIKMRLWCLRPAKAAMYEQLGRGQKLFDKYNELKGSINALFRLR